MKPCPECNGRKVVDEAGEWHDHKPGCSWSPMVPAAVVIDRVYPDWSTETWNRWRMGERRKP